ncbi:MAG: DUF3579 domain-containing protein [Burkholderiales bacterium]|jgi:hypothetical protein|nr:DUF3579 domain-containing protein [Betaproteobacteria bacterium]
MPHTQFIIVGRTKAGKQFRPSDWAERLCSQTASFCSKARMTYSPHMKPVVVDGFRSVLVNGEFEQADPRAWQFVLAFARDNDLEVRAEASCEEAPPVKVAGDEPNLPWPVAVEDVPYGAMLASIYAERDSFDDSKR